MNIKDWGRHKILAIKTENDDELKYYITNKLNMKPENIWKNYQNRKWIEAFYEDAKEIIGLRKFYMHARDSVMSYFNTDFRQPFIFHQKNCHFSIKTY